MRVGVAGCGYWGSKHVRVLLSLGGVDLVAAIDPSEERRTTLKGAFPGLRTFPDLPSAMTSIDALVIATPPGTHARLALEALRAGKHALIEKPMATTAADARMLINEADAAYRTLMVGHTFQYNAGGWPVRDSVASGELGRRCYSDTGRLNIRRY